MEKIKISFTLNDKPVSLSVNPQGTLLNLLREDLGLTGTKEGCGIGECGACTVIIDGAAVNSCLVLVGQIDGADIITIEALEKDGQLDRLQQSFVENHAVQCGFCTPGMLMSSKALLMKNPAPNDEEIRIALSGNLCRCTGYNNIISAVLGATD